MLNNLENYVWRYNSAVELVNLIFLFIEQNALKVQTFNLQKILSYSIHIFHTHARTHTDVTSPRADPNFLTHFTAKGGSSIFEWSTLSM